MYAPLIKRKKLRKQQWEAQLAGQQAILTLGHDWNRMMRIATSVIGGLFFLGFIFWDDIVRLWGDLIPEGYRDDAPSFPWALVFALGFFKPEIKVVFTPLGVFVYERSWRKPFGKYDILQYGAGVRLKLIRRREGGEFGRVRAAELETRDGFWRLAPEKPLNEEQAKLAINRLSKLLPVQLRSE